MRTILMAGLTAAGIGLAAVSGAAAAPVNGGVIGNLATATSPVTTVAYYWHHHHHWWHRHWWHRHHW